MLDSAFQMDTFITITREEVNGQKRMDGKWNEKGRGRERESD